ncbi:MAG: LacI family DNA-binding transcriptional regulator [Deinococcales bacterium]
MMSYQTITIKDVAKHAGVSSATVSRVLAQKPYVRQDLREKVLASVTALEYKPSRIAQSLRKQHSKVIGLVIGDIRNPFFTTLARAVEDIAYQHDYAVFLCNSDEDPQKEALYVNILVAENVAGIIIAPTQAQSPTYQNLLNSGTPLVALDRRIRNLDIDTVLSDNYEASYKLTNHLIAQGHRRIAAIMSHLSITTGQERLEGYKQALADHKLLFDKTLVLTGKPSEQDGYELAKKLLKQKPLVDAIFVGTKLMTLGVFRALQEENIALPKDIMLASFDQLDWLPRQYAELHLSFIEQPTYMLGETATHLLLTRIENPNRPVQRIILNSKLNVPPCVSA